MFCIDGEVLLLCVQVANIAAQKQAKAAEALQAAAKGVAVEQSTAQPEVKEAPEMVPAAPQDLESAKPVGTELSNEPQAKEIAPHAPVSLYWMVV